MFYQKDTSIFDNKISAIVPAIFRPCDGGKVFQTVMNQLYHKSVHHRYQRLLYRVVDNNTVIRCEDKGASYLSLRYIKNTSAESIAEMVAGVLVTPQEVLVYFLYALGQWLTISIVVTYVLNCPIFLLCQNRSIDNRNQFTGDCMMITFTLNGQ